MIGLVDEKSEKLQFYTDFNEMRIWSTKQFAET